MPTLAPEEMTNAGMTPSGREGEQRDPDRIR